MTKQSTDIMAIQLLGGVQQSMPILCKGNNRAVQSWTYLATYLATYCHISVMAVKYK
jgi:hypothetical protein